MVFHIGAVSHRFVPSSTHSSGTLSGLGTELEQQGLMNGTQMDARFSGSSFTRYAIASAPSTSGLYIKQAFSTMSTFLHVEFVQLDGILGSQLGQKSR